MLADNLWWQQWEQQATLWRSELVKYTEVNDDDQLINGIEVWVTFKLSAVQSETCHPWSRSQNVHDPLVMWRYMLLKSPEGFSLT